MGVKKTMKNWEKVFTTFELVRTITENAKNSYNPPRKKTNPIGKNEAKKLQ